MHAMNLLYLDTLIVVTILGLIVSVYIGSELKKFFVKPRGEGNDK